MERGVAGRHGQYAVDHCHVDRYSGRRLLRSTHWSVSSPLLASVTLWSLERKYDALVLLLSDTADFRKCLSRFSINLFLTTRTF